MSDEVPYDLQLRKTVGRLATYLQYYGDLLVRINRWDPDALAPVLDAYRRSAA
ncbi:hypothetical protein [Candidatus Poriferisodalis sp.]|uniref:hypothetical protein n=1 Tax=Candidatus Poriferisodalis sp. TaxID=3101277 RepID=UPI003B5B8D8E